MQIHKNSLRLARKDSPLNQSDIAFLLELPDFSNISRIEHGLRSPSNDVLFMYNLLFGTPIENLFDQQKMLHQKVKERVQLLLADLRSHRQSQKVVSRIAFLESVLTKLSE
jgi:transcriptional regulator with XRE-family HTH domain